MAPLKNIPSILQFSWYREKGELSFIVADLGIGIKSHLEQAYPQFKNDADAIEYALQPKVSGTFFDKSPYKRKDNAGAGLYFSSNIIRKLRADMHIVSGNGVVHISPTDITQKTISEKWPGTIVYVTLKIENDSSLNLHKIMSGFRESARIEIEKREDNESQQNIIVIENFFGKYAEDKQAAIAFREKRIVPSVNKSEDIIFDFSNVTSAPHSFLNASLAYPAQKFGMLVYKKVKIINAEPEIRETIDYILDDNTQ